MSTEREARGETEAKEINALADEWMFSVKWDSALFKKDILISKHN